MPTEVLKSPLRMRNRHTAHDQLTHCALSIVHCERLVGLSPFRIAIVTL